MTVAPRISSRVEQIGDRIDSLPAARFFLVALTPLLLVYLATASWTTVKSPDPMTNAISAWNLGTDGGVILDQHQGLADYGGGPAWIVDAEGDPVSQYPPGASLLATPLYAVWPVDAEVWTADDSRRWDDAPLDLVVPPLAPAALVAALSTALAVALAGLTARPKVGGATALAGTYLFGLGTGAWAVAADTLWQHGPGMLWIALGIWLTTRNKTWFAGAAFGLAILTRPPLAIVAAATGIAAGWKARSWLPVVRVASGSTAGLLAVVAYNTAVFGSPSISGGYGRGFATNAGSTDLTAYLENVSGGLFDSTRGLFALSPFVALLIFGLVCARRQVSPVMLGAALGGAAYLLVQWKANRFSGGSNFIGYRYPLEALAAATPALLMGWRWLKQRRVWRLLFLISAVYSIALYVSFVL